MYRSLALLALAPVSIGLSSPAASAGALSDADAVTCDGHPATVVVTSASPHVVHGTDHRDVVAVLHGGHVVRARGGDDLVCGSRRGDTVRAGGGDDHVRGRHGDDHLYGGTGDDVVLGGPGEDRCYGQDGADDVHGEHHDADDDGHDEPEHDRVS